MRRSFFACVLLVLSTFAFAKKASKIPAWVLDLQGEFPPRLYIAQSARADKAKTAQAAAVEELSRYISTQVESNLETSLSIFSDENSTTKNESVSHTVRIISNAKLFALRTTSPYYDKKSREWICAAYIKRDEAWEAYKPKVEQSKSEFYEFLNKAKNSSPLESLAFFDGAAEKGAEFLEALELTAILSPKEQVAYSEDRAAIAQVPVLAKQARLSCTVRLSISGDYEGAVKNALLKAFEDLGLTVAENGFYTARAVVEQNLRGSDGEGFELYPAVQVFIAQDGTKESAIFSAKVQEKTFAWTKPRALQTAFSRLSQKIQEEFPSRFAL